MNHASPPNLGLWGPAPRVGAWSAEKKTIPFPRSIAMPNLAALTQSIARRIKTLTLYGIFPWYRCAFCRTPIGWRKYDDKINRRFSSYNAHTCAKQSAKQPVVDDHIRLRLSGMIKIYFQDISQQRHTWFMCSASWKELFRKKWEGYMYSLLCMYLFYCGFIRWLHFSFLFVLLVCCICLICFFVLHFMHNGK